MRILKLFIHMVSIIGLAMLTSCASDDIHEEIEYKHTASTLNKHLDDTHEIGGVSCGVLEVIARENPQVRLRLYSFIDVMEIPGKGGTYDFTVNDDSHLNKLCIYENVEFFPHDYSQTWSGEHDAYQKITKDRPSADVEIDFTEMNGSDPSVVGIFENADPEKNLNSFTYSFPENHTGKYRLYLIRYSYSWHDMTMMGPVTEKRTETANYFIQMPD